MNLTTAWPKISARDFEELVFWVLHREGFFNVCWYGEAGSDKGRDIVCQRTELLGPRVVIKNCIVQCKKYGGRVSRQRLFEDILKASEHHPEYFILATSGVVNASTKDWIAAQQQNVRMQIILWERMDLQILLERHQDIRNTFLKVPFDTDYFIRHLASEGINTSPLDRILIAPAVRESLSQSCRMAIQYTNLVTVGHILSAMLLQDRECTRLVFLEDGIDPDKLSEVLEKNFIRKQPEVPIKQFGIQFSLSFRLALDIALKATKAVGGAILSEKVLLWSLLLQPYSGTLDFLQKQCRIDRRKLIDILRESFFTNKEWKSLVIPTSNRPYSTSNRLRHGNNVLDTAFIRIRS